jgi:hypothetical protein
MAICSCSSMANRSARLARILSPEPCNAPCNSVASPIARGTTPKNSSASSRGVWLKSRSTIDCSRPRKSGSTQVSAAAAELRINPKPCTEALLALSVGLAYSLKRMTAEQILDEIKALPQPERKRLLESVRRLEADEIPEDFVEALADFEQERFVSMETALNEVPPGQ